MESALLDFESWSTSRIYSSPLSMIDSEFRIEITLRYLVEANMAGGAAKGDDDKSIAKPGDFAQFNFKRRKQSHATKVNSIAFVKLIEACVG